MTETTFIIIWSFDSDNRRDINVDDEEGNGWLVFKTWGFLQPNCLYSYAKKLNPKSDKLISKFDKTR